MSAVQVLAEFGVFWVNQKNKHNRLTFHRVYKDVSTTQNIQFWKSHVARQNFYSQFVVLNFDKWFIDSDPGSYEVVAEEIYIYDKAAAFLVQKKHVS